jgi:hypothetical protein
MRLTQAGMQGVVSLLGTSLTSAQADWLSKAPIVLLMLDGDDPSRKAALIHCPCPVLPNLSTTFLIAWNQKTSVTVNSCQLSVIFLNQYS